MYNENLYKRMNSLYHEPDVATNSTISPLIFTIYINTYKYMQFVSVVWSTNCTNFMNNKMNFCFIGPSVFWFNFIRYVYDFCKYLIPKPAPTKKQYKCKYNCMTAAIQLNCNVTTRCDAEPSFNWTIYNICVLFLPFVCLPFVCGRYILLNFEDKIYCNSSKRKVRKGIDINRTL